MAIAVTEEHRGGIRVAVLAAAIAATALTYSFSVTSFLHAKELALAVGTLAMALASLRRPVPFSTAARAFLPLFCLLGIAGPLFLVSKRTIVAAPLVLPPLCLFIILLLFLLLTYDLFRLEVNVRGTHDAIVWTATAASALAILQYIGFLQSLFPHYPSASPIYSVFGNSGLLGGFVAIALPLALHRIADPRRARILDVAVIPFLMAALLLSGARTAWLAGAIGVVVVMWQYPVSIKRSVTLAGVLAGVTTLCVLLAPTATVARIAATFTPADAGSNLRLWFWTGTWGMIRNHWLTGVGLGHYAFWSPSYLGDVLWNAGGEHYAHNTLLTEHPHNEVLALWAETGVLGIACGAWMLWKLARCRGPEWGALSAALVFSLFNAPFHSAPHALTCGILAACLLARRETEQRYPPKWAVPLSAAAVALVLAALWVIQVRPSVLLRAAQTAHIEGKPTIELYNRAVETPFARAEAHEQFGIAHLDAHRFDEAATEFRNALASSDAGSVYLGLATAEFKLGREKEAREAVIECLHRWPSSTDAWFILSEVSASSDRPAIKAAAGRFLRSAELSKAMGVERN